MHKVTIYLMRINQPIMCVCVFVCVLDINNLNILSNMSQRHIYIIMLNYLMCPEDTKYIYQ